MGVGLVKAVKEKGAACINTIQDMDCLLSCEGTRVEAHDQGNVRWYD
jgi:hypothetical protein